MEDKTGLALSIQQPWAWLIVNGHKDVENRDWPTNIRGWIGIHAGKTFDRESYDYVQEMYPEIHMPAVGQFPMGGIVGRAYLSDCVTQHPSTWFFGEYGFVMLHAEPIKLMPCRGMLKFFKPEFSTPPRSAN